MGFNAADKDNQGSSEKKKIYETKSDLMSEIDSVNKDISASDKASVYLNSFKYQLFIFFSFFYSIPIFLTLLFSSLYFFNEENNIFILRDLFSEETIDFLIKYGYNFIDTYTYYINFGWLASIFGFDYQTLFNFYTSVLTQDTEQNVVMGVSLLTTLTYLVLTFLIGIFFTFIFRKRLVAESTLEQLIKKLNKAYIANQNQTAKEKYDSSLHISESAVMEAEKTAMKFSMDKDIKMLKKTKKDILEQLKKGKYTIIEAKEIFNLAIAYKDSPFANMVSSIVNRATNEIVKDLLTMKTDEELYSLLFLNFSDYQKRTIFSYNFDIFSEKKNKKIKDNFKPMWEKLKNNKNKRKEDYIKALAVIRFFKNYPDNIIYKYLESQGLKFTKEDKLFVSEYRWIVFYYMEKRKNVFIKMPDMPLKLTFPSIKNKDKLIELYQVFLNINKRETMIMKTIMPAQLAAGATQEEIAENEERANEELSKKIKIYVISLKKILKKMILIILNDLNIEVKNNFDKILSSTIIEYYKIKSNQSFTENQSLVSQFSVFKIDDFYAILNMVRKKIGNYEIEIEPEFAERYKKLNLDKVWYYIKKDRNPPVDIS